MNQDQVVFELFKAGLSLLVAALLGQRIVVYWERRKKQNEIDLTTLSQLHRIHAEFRILGRLWRNFAIGAPDDGIVPISDDIHWGLQQRAAAAEGEMEALVVKLATERVLSDAEIEALAFLREAYQLLRRSIRDRRWFYWKSGSVPYLRSYLSVIVVAAVLSRRSDLPGRHEACEALDRIRQVSEQLHRMDWFRALATDTRGQLTEMEQELRS